MPKGKGSSGGGKPKGGKEKSSDASGEGKKKEAKGGTAVKVSIKIWLQYSDNLK